MGCFVGMLWFEENFDGYMLFDLVVIYGIVWGDVGVGIENLLDCQYVGYYV